MKLKSYHILFRFFSFLSDKTNGAHFFVKYKLLLGTLILGITSTANSKSANQDSIPDTTPSEPSIEEITCYKPAIPKDREQKVVITGQVRDESREVLIGASVLIKGTTNNGTLTDVGGNFKLTVKPTDTLIISYLGFNTQEIPVSEIQKNNKPIILIEDNMILCYDPVVTRHYKDDIYDRRAKRKTKLSYYETHTPPLSPVGNLDDFKNWMDKNVQYTPRMLTDKVEGEVMLSFTIDKDGKITDKKVIRKLSPEADAEALRVLASSEKWKPGIYNQKTVKTTITISVNFILPNHR